MNRLNKNLSKFKSYLLFRRIQIIPLTGDIPGLDIPKIISGLQSIVRNPSFFNRVEYIYFGNFEFLKNRAIQAMYSDNCIYVSDFSDTNKKPSELKIIRYIIHELAHSLESDFDMELYADQEMTSEFIRKKETLCNSLKSLNKYNFSCEDFVSNTEYSPELDNVLYNVIGYNTLWVLSSGLFTSPYSITSLSEYFANGFEEYFCGDQSSLKNTCPVLFRKIKEITKYVKS